MHITKQSQQLVIALHELQHVVFSREQQNIDDALAKRDARKVHADLEAAYQQWIRSLVT